MSREIPIGGIRGVGLVAIVDDADYETLSPFNWSLSHKGYARRSIGGRGQRCEIYMARFVVGLEPGDERQVDHINGRRLDNRRSNLRICTLAEQAQNRHVSRGTSSHRGVSWNRYHGKWESTVRADGVRHWLGRHDDELVAARVAAEARRRLMPFSSEAAPR